MCYALNRRDSIRLLNIFLIIAFIVQFNRIEDADIDYKTLSIEMSDLKSQIKKLKEEKQEQRIVYQVLECPIQEAKEVLPEEKMVCPIVSSGIQENAYIETAHTDPITNEIRSNKGKFILGAGLGYGTIGSKIERQGTKVIGTNKVGIYPMLYTDYFLNEKTTVGFEINNNSSVALRFGYLFSGF